MRTMDIRVLSVTDQSDGEEVIMVGKLAYAAEGDMIEGQRRYDGASGIRPAAPALRPAR